MNNLAHSGWPTCGGPLVGAAHVRVTFLVVGMNTWVVLCNYRYGRLYFSIIFEMILKAYLL